MSSHQNIKTNNIVFERLIQPDLLKGIAVLLMIQVHLTELFAVGSWFHGIAGKISLFLGGPFAAPVFMAVMGYFIARGNKSFKQNIFQGLKLILWGLLLNIGLNAHLLIKIINGTIQLSPWPYVFGVDILFLAGLSVILIALLRKIFGNKLIFWLLSLLIIGFVNEFLPVYDGTMQWVQYVQAYFWGFYHWSYFPLFPWAAYPLAGYLFYLLEQKYKLNQWPETRLIRIAVFLLLIILFTFNFGFSQSIYLQGYYHHDGWFMLWALALVLLWVLIVKMLLGTRRKGHILKYFCWIGKNVTSFYVFQWLLIGNFATSFYQTQYPLQLLFWLVMITAMSSVLVLLWNKFKAFRKQKVASTM